LDTPDLGRMPGVVCQHIISSMPVRITACHCCVVQAFSFICGFSTSFRGVLLTQYTLNKPAVIMFVSLLPKVDTGLLFQYS